MNAPNNDNKIVKIKCIESNSRHYTVGKVYDVEYLHYIGMATITRDDGVFVSFNAKNVAEINMNTFSEGVKFVCHWDVVNADEAIRKAAVLSNKEYYSWGDTIKLVHDNGSKFKVKCVKSCTTLFIKGNVYEIKDEGIYFEERKIMGILAKNCKELNNSLRSQFVPYCDKPVKFKPFKVVCCYTYDIEFTRGKVYKVGKGKIKTNFGWQGKGKMDICYNTDDLNRIFTSQFIPYEKEEVSLNKALAEFLIQIANFFLDGAISILSKESEK